VFTRLAHEKIDAPRKQMTPRLRLQKNIYQTWLAPDDYSTTSWHLSLPLSLAPLLALLNYPLATSLSRERLKYLRPISFGIDCFSAEVKAIQKPQWYIA
jgi:hypothetical protein